MFTRVLIANRGEIALRVIRTCKRMGIETVAIYSDADVRALHVAEADHAVGIGGFTPRESYLIIEKVIEAARTSGADAVHPGYGFLSENAEFARAVAAAGMTFIGPTPEAIAMLGDKTAARELAIASNVPISPGSDGAVSTFDDARSVVERIGFPVIIKAAAGGGGKGMRIVEDASEIESAFLTAQNEARTSFNDDRVFIERYLWCISLSVNARCSVVTRRLSKNHHRWRSRRRSARPWVKLQRDLYKLHRIPMLVRSSFFSMHAVSFTSWKSTHGCRWNIR